MNILKTLFKNRSSRRWAIISTSVMAFLLVVIILTATIFNSILSTVLGGRKPIFDTSSELTASYESEYGTKQASYEAGNALNVEIAGEGFTLLLNEGGLPISNSSKVSVFGKNSVDLVLGGSGSGGISGDAAKTLYDGLTLAGLSYNPLLKEFYEDNSRSGRGRSSNPTLSTGATTAPTLDIGETPISSYSGFYPSYKEYGDAAIVVISRIGGESFDLPRAQADDADRHYLQLDANEYDMLDMVTSEFDNVIVLINAITAFQCDFITEYNNMNNDPRIDAVLWIGGPGSTGADAIGKILTGEINPSGKTVDIYSKDYTKDPTWANFGDYSQANGGASSLASSAVAAFLENGSQPSPSHYMVMYEESIYMGYRYYETRGFTDGEDWYEENVIFPFGYGLSYTTFEQTIVSESGNFADGFDISVEVSNLGNVKGKDVVQLYVSTPYIQDEIEKSYVQLVDYAKTDLLAAHGGTGDKQTISFHINPYDFASYDYNDANHNGFSGYELDAGDYTFFISANSHVSQYAYDSITKTLADGIRFDKDPTTNVDVVNRYTTNDLNDSAYRMSDVMVNNQTRKGMSRTDWEGTWPTAPEASERWYLDDEREKLMSVEHNNTDIEQEALDFGMPKTGVDVLDIEVIGDNGEVSQRAIVLRDVVGLDYNDEKWDVLLDRLTVDEMAKLANYGAFLTEAIPKIGKPITNDSDGPIGFVNFLMNDGTYKNNTTFASQIVIASTWNKDLAFRMGKAVGDNAVWGGIDGNGLPYTGWYAPAVNIHRSPFSGRNFEYYSEDPVLSGKMAVNVINGAKTMGVYTDLKHFAVNDQETNRAGVATYLTEQSLREIYLKPFEIAVKGHDVVAKSAAEFATSRGIENYKYTGTTGMMSSFNRIGTVWTGGDYRLMTQILRHEWGFKGLVICDYKTESFMDSKQMLYAGNDLILTSTDNNRWNNYSASSVQDVIILRKAAHNILYAVANSNAMNNEILGYILPWWQILIIVITAVAFVGFGVWGFFVLKKIFKKTD